MGALGLFLGLWVFFGVYLTKISMYRPQMSTVSDNYRKIEDGVRKNQGWHNLNEIEIVYYVEIGDYHNIVKLRYYFLR